MFPNCKNVISKTYFHRATIKRNVSSVVSNETIFTMTTVYTAIKCALSFKGTSSNSNNAGQTPIENRIELGCSLFCDPSYIIKAGDFIEVTLESGMVKKLKAGEPNYFVSHTETPCEVIERA